MPERVSAGSSVRATVTFVLTGLPSSFTSFEVVSVAPCLSAAMASSFVMPSTAARLGTFVFLAVAVVASFVSSVCMEPTSCELCCSWVCCVAISWLSSNHCHAKYPSAPINRISSTTMAMSTRRMRRDLR